MFSDRKYFLIAGSKGAAPKNKYLHWSRPNAFLTLLKTIVFAILNYKEVGSLLIYLIEPSGPILFAQVAE
jgi:hypothetical protein